MGVFSVQGCAPGLRHLHQRFRFNGEKLAEDRLLDHCVHKAGEGYEDAPVFLRLEFLHNEVEHRLQFQQGERVRQAPGGFQPFIPFGQRGVQLAADGDVVGVFRSVLPGHFDEVGIQAAAEAAVRVHQQHQVRAAVGLHQGAVAGVYFILKMVEHFRQGADIGAPLHGLVLGAAHLGGGHHLHRPGDLGRVFDGFDPASDVSQVAHVSVLP